MREPVSITWVKDLPREERNHRSRYDWWAIATDLRKRPGEWALVLRNVPRSHATAIREGRKKAFQPAGDWEVRTRGPKGSIADLYMRFIGAPGARLKDGGWEDR